MPQSPQQEALNVGPLAPVEVNFLPPLLQSLSTLLRLRGKPVSAEFLRAGLPGMGTISPGACLRSAAHAGLDGRILYRKSIEHIPRLTFPCILLLTNDRSCVLTRIFEQKAPPLPEEKPKPENAESKARKPEGKAGNAETEVKNAAAAAGNAETEVKNAAAAAGNAEAEVKNAAAAAGNAEQRFAEVYFPETGEQPQVVPLLALAEDYSGYAIFATITNPQEKRITELHQNRPRRWFWDVLRYYMPIYKHVAFASIVINLIGVLTPLFVMNVYDRVIPNAATDTLWVLAIGVVIAYVFDFLLRSLRSYFVDVAGRNADVVISSNLVHKVLSMRMDAKPESTGALVNNLREFESLREFFSSSTILACIDVPFLIVFLLLIGLIGGPLVFLPLAAIPILLFAGLLLQISARRSAEQSFKQSMQKNALLVELVNGLETLKCCLAESRMQSLWESVVGASALSTNQSRKYNNLALTLSTLVTQLVTVGIIVWGVYLITAGTLTMGALIGTNILVGRALAPLMQMASLLTRYQNSRIALESLDKLMMLPSEELEGHSSVDFGTLEPGFTVEHLSFAYPGADRLALDNINLTIRPGERVGIIGRMGSGKSTLGRLLIGLYQPRDGAVKFGNVDIRQLPPADLRGRIGFLPQDVTLFYGSIRDNISLGDPTINDHLLLRAANIASVSDFVRANPAGFGTQVGEQGKSLSGGQRQAVALARALVRDPEVLILDEPSSNMDNSTEQTVQRRLHTILPGKTFLLITHRLSMLAMVDRLLVMEGGRIVLDGPRNEVLQQLKRSPAPQKQEADLS